LDYARQHSPGLGRRELSLLLLNELLRSTGLDTFERGDVFAQVAALLPTPAPVDQDKIDDLAAKVTIPLSIPPRGRQFAVRCERSDRACRTVARGVPESWPRPW
ncbi:MAG TPA: hypothetical protein VNO31_11270, partial [Umezawaea sp.]|nr:hypothetical protein [Umezawaea sp.]